MFAEHGDREDWTLISVGVNSGEGPEEQLKYAIDNSYAWNFVHDTDGSVAQQYDVQGIPTLVWIGSDGVIQRVGYGEVAHAVRQELDAGPLTTSGSASGEGLH